MAKSNLKLRQVTLKNNKGIGDDVILAMQQTTVFSNLELLNLSNCSISDKGVKLLSECNFASNLQYLSIARNTFISLL